MYLGGTFAFYSIIYCKMSTKRDITSQKLKKVHVIGFSKDHIWKENFVKLGLLYFIFLQICLEKCLVLLSSVWGAERIAECFRLTSSTLAWILSMFVLISSTSRKNSSILLPSIVTATSSPPISSSSDWAWKLWY